MNRRTFWMGAAGAAFAADGRVTLGVIGAGGRGAYVMTEFQKDTALRVGAICDVYEPNLERALGTVRKAQDESARAVRRYQELLADRSIDAVLIATPEHWHHRMVLDALAAGKDVYVEKPLCQTPGQGVELVEAERKSKQIVQVGMQRRSYDLYMQGREIVAAGTLGAVRMVRSWWLNNQLGGGPAAALEGKLDWEQWQGPAARHAMDPLRFRNWRLFADYAGGIVADQGAHVFDGIHMLMNASYPLAVTAAAGRVHRPNVDTPESVVVTAEYPEDFLGVFSINYAAMRYATKNDQLNQLDGDKARMDIGRETLRVFAAGKEEEVAVERKSARGFGFATELHVRNFLECVRTRKRPTAPMALGFQAALVVQLANLSLRQGRRMRWNAAAQRVEAA
ncbi:MAG TPA: Gfo/Idh/MocA family oxidoreductase [Bryobacteraceae bacterium]|nr:Gfo/Idh/MocA family oxidoreductase [Bryobacteraceae bacterium]